MMTKIDDNDLKEVVGGSSNDSSEDRRKRGFFASLWRAFWGPSNDDSGGLGRNGRGGLSRIAK